MNMEKIENYYYQKLNYQIYQNRIKELIQNEELKQLGLEYSILARTTYQYNLDCVTIGYGKKELFLIGGTHSSETISIDFLLNLISQIPNIKEFDPNLFKLIIIPVQNPEGFDISSNTLKTINENNFQEKSYEYYLRYRTDTIIVQAIKELNQFFHNTKNNPTITANQILTNLKMFVQTNTNWKKLSDPRATPNIKIFNNKIKQLETISNEQELKQKLLKTCNDTIDLLNLKNIHDNFLYLFLSILKNGLSQDKLWNEIKNEQQKKLYQQMFEKETFDGITNKIMKSDIETMYEIYNHPKGSQIGHDSTGTGINLNANHPLNPGIEAIKNRIIIPGPNAKNNIKNYFPGPLGIPTINVFHFEYSIENLILQNLISKSYLAGNYLATLLFHGTGGQIFYQPYLPLMDSKEYQEFYEYNEVLAQIYSNCTNYQLLNNSDSTGYGDYLRRTYPGVLLIELSKMGGNPIGPYGDKNNIYQVFQDNTNAIKNILNYFAKKNNKIKILAQSTKNN